MSSVLIYENIAGGASIKETATSLEVSLSEAAEAIYKTHFVNYGGVLEGKQWVFSKTNDLHLGLLSSVIGKDIRTLFSSRFKPPTPIGLGGVGDLLAAMKTVAPPGTIPTPPPSGEGGDEFKRNVIFSFADSKCEGVCKGNLCMVHTVKGTVVDYSPFSLVLFTDAAWGSANSAHLRNVAIFNSRMKCSNTDPNMSMPGWAFKKSDTKAVAFLTELCGVDIASRYTPIPAKGSRYHGSARPAYPGSYQAPVPASTPSFPGMAPPSGPSITNIPGGLPGIPSGTPLPSAPPKAVSIEDHMDSIYKLLLQPMSSLSRKVTDDVSGTNVHLALSGPMAHVEEAILKYKSEYPTESYATGIEMDIKIGPNRAVFITRVANP